MGKILLLIPAKLHVKKCEPHSNNFTGFYSMTSYIKAANNRNMNIVKVKVQKLVQYRH